MPFLAHLPHPIPHLEPRNSKCLNLLWVFCSPWPEAETFTAFGHFLIPCLCCIFFSLPSPPTAMSDLSYSFPGCFLGFPASACICVRFNGCSYSVIDIMRFEIFTLIICHHSIFTLYFSSNVVLNILITEDIWGIQTLC